jgi:O-antigen/teichoic acid export membrane protein
MSATTSDPDSKPSGRFQRDALWNWMSLVVRGISGILLNALIARHYGDAVLGVFNQGLAAYTIFSQLAVGGLNLSALRLIAEDPTDRRRLTSLVASVLAPTLLLASVATAIYWFARTPLSALLESPGVATAIAASTPGLFCFAINKVLLSIVNGVQRMRAFAIYTALRYSLILVGLLIAMRLEFEGARLMFVFSFAEGVLMLVLLVETALLVRGPLDAGWRAWIPIHFVYGAKSVASGIMLELNAKVDIWMIGVFMRDEDVGVYTIAAMVAEGVYQLLIVLQNMYNPLLARDIAARRWTELEAMVKKGRRLTYAGMALVGALAVACYPFAVSVMTDDPAFAASWTPFALLMTGIVLASGYIPFGQTLLMSGHPGWHSGLMIGTVACNIACNALLIPRLGLPGAAIATAFAVACSVIMLRVLVRRHVGFRL